METKKTKGQTTNLIIALQIILQKSKQKQQAKLIEQDKKPENKTVND